MICFELDKYYVLATNAAAAAHLAIFVQFVKWSAALPVSFLAQLFAHKQTSSECWSKLS